MIECPYCEQEENEPDDCYEPSTTYFTECSHCNKEYSFEIEYDPRYYTSKIPCQDGEPHNWRFQYKNQDKDFYKCLYCDKKESRDKL